VILIPDAGAPMTEVTLATIDEQHDALLEVLAATALAAEQRSTSELVLQAD
jgi:hypothetical protein